MKRCKACGKIVWPWSAVGTNFYVSVAGMKNPPKDYTAAVHIEPGPIHIKCFGKAGDVGLI